MRHDVGLAGRRNAAFSAGPGGAVQPADGDAEVARRHAGRQPAAVVAGVGEVDVALAVALRADAHVVAAAGVRQLDRRRPAVAQVGRGEHVPAALDGPAVDARVAAGAVAERQPHAAVAVVLQLRQFVVLLACRRQDAVKVGFGVLPFAVHQAARCGRAASAYRRVPPAVLVEEAGVLAPLRRRIRPRRPTAGRRGRRPG